MVDMAQTDPDREKMLITLWYKNASEYSNAILILSSGALGLIIKSDFSKLLFISGLCFFTSIILVLYTYINNQKIVLAEIRNKSQEEKKKEKLAKRMNSWLKIVFISGGLLLIIDYINKNLCQI